MFSICLRVCLCRVKGRKATGGKATGDKATGSKAIRSIYIYNAKRLIVCYRVRVKAEM
jgi:hypothetical protein